MQRRHPQSVGKGSPDLPWELVPSGIAVWRTCRRHIRKRRYPPTGWSWPDWREEIEAVCFARALEALGRFDPERNVPLAAFLQKQVHYALSERYREEIRFAAHCHANSAGTRDLASREEDVDSEEGAAAWLALHALPDSDRTLLKRLILEDESEACLACELGVSQATISRHKRRLLEELRARLTSSEKFS